MSEKKKEIQVRAKILERMRKEHAEMEARMARYREHSTLYTRTALDLYEDGMQGRLPH